MIYLLIVIIISMYSRPEEEMYASSEALRERWTDIPAILPTAFGEANASSADKN